MQNNTRSGYQDQLLAELSRRKLSNPSYSLRAFARALDVSPAFLSKVLKRQKDLSTDTAALISAKLGYNDQESEQFCRLVQLGKSSSPVAKRMLSQGLESKEGSAEFHSIDLEIFQVISDWYHFAILELVSCESRKLTPELASKRLGITPEEAKAAIARLVRLELLVMSRGRLIKSKSFIATPSGKPNQALRNFHSQMIEKARRALETQSVEARDISGITLPISADKLELAKREIKAFRRRMAKLLDSSRPTEVYQLNIQFFALTAANEGTS